MDFRDRILNFLIVNTKYYKRIPLPVIKALLEAENTLTYTNSSERIHEAPPPDSLKLIGIGCGVIMTVEEVDKLRGILTKKTDIDHRLFIDKRNLSDSLLGGSTTRLADYYNEKKNYFTLDGRKCLMNSSVDFANVWAHSLTASIYLVSITAFLNENADQEILSQFNLKPKVRLRFGRYFKGQFSISCPSGDIERESIIKKHLKQYVSPIIAEVFSGIDDDRMNIVPLYAIDEPQSIFKAVDRRRKRQEDLRSIGVFHSPGCYYSKTGFIQTGDGFRNSNLMISNYTLLENREAKIGFGHSGRLKVYYESKYEFISVLGAISIIEYLNSSASKVAKARARLLTFQKRPPSLRKVARIQSELMHNWIGLDRLSFELRDEPWMLRRFLQGLSEYKTRWRSDGVNAEASDFSAEVLERVTWHTSKISKEALELRRVLQELSGIKNLLYGYWMQWLAFILAIIAITISIIKS